MTKKARWLALAAVLLPMWLMAAPGVVDTPCVGVQWKPSTQWGWSMEVVDNTLMPNVPLTGTLEPTNK